MENIQENMTVSEKANTMKKISGTGKASFGLCMAGFLLTLFNFINSSAGWIENSTAAAILGIIQVSSFFTSLFFAVLDLLGKDSRKTISKVSAVISGVFILLFIVLLMLLNIGQ